MHATDRLAAYFEPSARKRRAVAAAALLAVAWAAYAIHASHADHRARMDLAAEILLGSVDAELMDRQRWGRNDPEGVAAIVHAGGRLQAIPLDRGFGDGKGGSPFLPPVAPGTRALLVANASVLEELESALDAETGWLPVHGASWVTSLRDREGQAVSRYFDHALAGLIARGSAALEDGDLEAAFAAARRMYVLGRILRRGAGRGGPNFYLALRARATARFLMRDLAHRPGIPAARLAAWRNGFEAEVRIEEGRGSFLTPLRRSRDEKFAGSFAERPEAIYFVNPRPPLQRMEDFVLGNPVPMDVRLVERPPPPPEAVRRARDLAQRIDAAWDARDAAALAHDGELGVLARQGGIDGYCPASLGADPGLALWAWRVEAADLLLRIHLRLRVMEAEGKVPITEADLPADLPVDPWTGKRPEILLREDGWLLRAGPSGTVEFEGAKKTWDPETLEYVRPAK